MKHYYFKVAGKQVCLLRNGAIALVAKKESKKWTELMWEITLDRKKHAEKGRQRQRVGEGRGGGGRKILRNRRGNRPAQKSWNFHEKI